MKTPQQKKVEKYVTDDLESACTHTHTHTHTYTSAHEQRHSFQHERDGTHLFIKCTRDFIDKMRDLILSLTAVVRHFGKFFYSLACQELKFTGFPI